MGISPSESGGASVPPRLDTSSAHSARVWNYLLGGKDNFAADREVGDMILQMFPGIAHIARLQRRFLGRAVRYLAGEAGIRQFLDIGTGLPTADNTHQIAQQLAPESRIVYVDNDPLVLVHARALLTSAPGGMTSYIEADVRDTEEILGEAAGTLDFSQPIALMMLGIMGQLPDSAGALRAPVDRDHAAGRAAAGQLPGPVRRHQHEPGAEPRDRRVQPELGQLVPPAQPGGDRPLLRRPDAGPAGRGHYLPVAAGPG